MKRRNLLTGLAASASTVQVAQAQGSLQPQPQPKPLLVLHRVTAAATVRAPLHTIDLVAWAFQLTSEDYVRCAPQEHNGAVQARLPDGRSVFVSVETMGGNFMSHQYVADIAARDHLRAASPSSQIWSSGASLPAPMRVTWELKLQAIDSASCRLDCEVLVETDNAEMVAWMERRPANYQNPVQAHCSVETPAFAADMERKALQGIYAIRVQ